MGDCKYKVCSEVLSGSKHQYFGVVNYFASSCHVAVYCGLTYCLCVYVCVCSGCFALCCLPVFTCKVTSAVGACPCLPLLDCVGCASPASLAMRASARERYGIQGSVWSDCLYGCCCYSLSWLQTSRELKRRAASHASSSPSSARYTTLTSLQGAHLVWSAATTCLFMERVCYFE
uniref:Uncharacterized protein n=1 Tax=Monopterus albus TaxID=43700 RepID=A0A3Q3QQM7_MONAL